METKVWEVEGSKELQAFLSPASYQKWTLQHALSKIWTRSPYLNKPTELKVISAKSGSLGDKDLNIHIEVCTVTQWTESPAVEIIADFPIHLTIHNEIQNGFSYGIDSTPEDPKDWGGVVRVYLGDKVYYSSFTWDILSPEDLSNMGKYILYQVRRKAIEKWLQWELGI